MFKKSYSADQRLEIIILGPMRGQKADSSKRIHDAVKALLSEDKAATILFDKGITQDPVITYPEEWQDHNIEDGVFSKLDTADLIIVNITPKPGKTDPTPNVFYELGLIHALGIPYLLLIQEGHKVPFYVQNTRNYPLRNFGVKTLIKKLREPIYSFIVDRHSGLFTDNIISRFYGNLPVIDISAAVGLATGYYVNFVRRILKDDGFISFYPETIKHLIIVRPFNIFNTYQQDRENLVNVLERNGMKLSFQKYDPVPTDQNNAIYFDHIDGVVIDLPRTIYPLKKSPRLLSLKKRINQKRRTHSRESKDSTMNQAADKLIDKIEDIINYHLEMDEERMRKNLLHFATLDEVPALVNRLRG